MPEGAPEVLAFPPLPDGSADIGNKLHRVDHDISVTIFKDVIVATGNQTNIPNMLFQDV